MHLCKNIANSHPTALAQLHRVITSLSLYPRRQSLIHTHQPKRHQEAPPRSRLPEDLDRDAEAARHRQGQEHWCLQFRHQEPRDPAQEPRTQDHTRCQPGMQYLRIIYMLKRTVKTNTIKGRTPPQQPLSQARQVLPREGHPLHRLLMLGFNRLASLQGQDAVGPR